MSTPIRPFVNRLLGGTLDARLRKLRAAGLSQTDIARELSDEVGEVLSRELIRRWLLEDGIA